MGRTGWMAERSSPDHPYDQRADEQSGDCARDHMSPDRADLGQLSIPYLGVPSPRVIKYAVSILSEFGRAEVGTTWLPRANWADGRALGPVEPRIARITQIAHSAQHYLPNHE